MGAWGHGVFENDSACDWAFELVRSADDGPIADALSCGKESGGEVDSDDASQALAAVQTLVALSGQPVELTDEVAQWVGRQPPERAQALLDEHRALAREVLTLIDQPDCELYELWEDAEDLEDWRATVTALRAHLAQEAR